MRRGGVQQARLVDFSSCLGHQIQVDLIFFLLIGVILERWGDYMEYIFITEFFLLTVRDFFCNARFTKVRGGDVSRTPIISFGDGIQIKFTAKNWSSFLAPYLWKCMFLTTFSCALVYKQIENNNDPSSSMKESQTSHREEDEVNLFM